MRWYLLKVEEFRNKVNQIVESEIKLDGHVNLIINNISEQKQKIILMWIKECKLGMTKPEPCKNFKNLIAFIYKSNDNRIRGVLTKKKNSFFLELFLDKHKYYDRKRKYLGL